MTGWTARDGVQRGGVDCGFVGVPYGCGGGVSVVSSVGSLARYARLMPQAARPSRISVPRSAASKPQTHIGMLDVWEPSRLRPEETPSPEPIVASSGGADGGGTSS